MGCHDSVLQENRPTEGECVISSLCTAGLSVAVSECKGLASVGGAEREKKRYLITQGPGFSGRRKSSVSLAIKRFLDTPHEFSLGLVVFPADKQTKK